MEGPALAGFDCFFVAVSGSGINNPTLPNLVSGCSSLQLGVSSSHVTLQNLVSGVQITSIPSGTARSIKIFGVKSSACSRGQNVSATQLFSDTAEVPEIHEVASSTVDLSADKTISLSVAYNAATSSSSTAACKNIWQSMSTTNAPTARQGHSAIWTGSKMIIWGGSSANPGDGGIYDPSMDTWSSLSTQDAPSLRSSHTAVWTGSKMIVWGGGSNLNSGGIYSLANDSWTATSVTNVPSGRNDHSVVWTGSKMIVWGGNDGSSSVNSGGIFTP